MYDLDRPPYPMHELYTQILNLFSDDWFKGLVLIESDEDKGPSRDCLPLSNFTTIKEFQQGSSFLLIMERA
jgi:hypothetical protein